MIRFYYTARLDFVFFIIDHLTEGDSLCTMRSAAGNLVDEKRLFKEAMQIAVKIELARLCLVRDDNKRFIFVIRQ